MQRMVEITQRIDGQERVERVPESAVPFWAASGWTPRDKNLSPETAAGPVDAAAPGGETEPDTKSGRAGRKES
jgi:hypothetical protein